MKQHPFCIYRQNISIIRNFLARPLTLVIGIFFAVTTILYTVSGLFPLSNSINVRFDAISIMLSIAFFLFYFFSRSKKADISLRAPVALIKTVSIINIVLAGIAFSMLAFLILLALVIPTSPISKMLNVFLLITSFVSPVLLAQLFFYIFFLVFAGSIKKSVSSIYLRKRGAGAFGVTAIILIIFNIALIFIPTFLLQSNAALQNLSDIIGSSNAQSYINSYFAGSGTLFSNNIMFIIDSCIKYISFILLAVFAFSYKNYINKYTKKINLVEDKQEMQVGFVPHFTETPVSPETPAENRTPFLADAVFNDTPAMAPPIPPQHDTNNSQVAFDPNTISFFDENQNPYTQPPLLEQFQICPHCGNWCNFDDSHCGTCGHKLK